MRRRYLSVRARSRCRCESGLNLRTIGLATDAKDLSFTYSIPIRAERGATWSKREKWIKHRDEKASAFLIRFTHFTKFIFFIYYSHFFIHLKEAVGLWCFESDDEKFQWAQARQLWVLNCPCWACMLTANALSAAKSLTASVSEHCEAVCKMQTHAYWIHFTDLCVILSIHGC